MLLSNGETKMVDIVRKRRERVYEQIVEQIQQLIRDKVLSPGDQLLPERQLAEKLGVSRAALREALTVLVSRGLIEVTPGGGAYVRESSIQDLVDPLAAVMLKERENIFDLLEARIILEIGAVKLAAARADKGDLYEIRGAALESNERMRSGSIADDPDVDFHLTIARAAHNPVLLSMMSMISSLDRELYGPSTRRILENPGRVELFAEQNLAICAAIQDRDPELAGRLMSEHLSMTSEDLRRIYGEEAAR